MVFYRKYRPQTIDQLDKEEIRSRLTSVFKMGRIPHAFLFTGPKGTGKTSTARIIAKIINCENRKKDGIEPCNKCGNCKSIERGNNLDVFEIDAASNRGVDEIRSLRETVALAPSTGKYKVYIIDEVHMLTREAFNALLKTLEEPPAHVVFILATTEIEKLPETIVSRCLTYTFTKATVKELLRSLKRVTTGEKIKVDDKVLELLVTAADGSFRDAVKLLEQAYSENLLDEKGIAKFLGTQGLTIKEFALLLENKKTTEALEYIKNLENRGANLKHFTELLINFLHDELLSRIMNHESRIKNFELQESDLKRLINLFSKAYQESKYSFIESLPVEMAVIEWCESSA